MNKMKFGDMKSGQWFREIRGDGKEKRIFVKLQNVLPSGIKVAGTTRVTEDRFYASGEKMATRGEIFGEYNSIDSQGVPGRCPNWLEFELLDNPFER